MFQINLSSFQYQIIPIQNQNLTNQIINEKNKQLFNELNIIFQQNKLIDERTFYIQQLKTITNEIETNFTELYQFIMNYIHYTFNQINQLLHSSDSYSSSSIIYSITCYNGGILYYLLLKAINSNESDKISEIKSILNLSDSLQQLILFEMNEDDRHLSGFKSSLVCVNKEIINELPIGYQELYHQMKQIQLPVDLTEDYCSCQHYPF